MAYTTSEEAGRAASLDFARRRVARIYSGYWPFYALALSVFWFARPQHVAESALLKSFFLWPQPLNRVLLEITWTLSYELYFYLLFALLVLFVPQRRRLALCTGVTAVILVASVYRHFVAASFSGQKLYLMPFAIDFLGSPFLLEFFAGTLLAYWLNRRRSGPSLAYLVAGSLAFVAGGAVNHWVFNGNIEQGFHVVPRVLWFGASSVLIVAGLVRMESRGLKAPANFSVRTGGASYAIYLSHIPLLVLAQALGLPVLLQGRPFGLVALAYLLLMVLILALSVAHYQWLERPLHRLFKQALGVRRKPVTRQDR